ALLTFDALHSVKANITWLVEMKKAHYIAVIKTNQPTAYSQLAVNRHLQRLRLSPAKLPELHTALESAYATGYGSTAPEPKTIAAAISRRRDAYATSH
ncbi:hypothetical protein ACWGJX_48260, partial [Streptomyces sp. NPDC054775]